MITNNRQLLCTFSTKFLFKETIEKIRKFYDIQNGKFFVFQNVKDDREVFITYNIIVVKNDNYKFTNTISIHRKKQTCTLYTINAMNRLIEDDNGGVLDKNYSIDWNLYRDTFILTGDPLKIIPIKFLDIIS